MKGLTHFAVGVAWASSFPVAVEAGASGNPWFFALGAAAGLLPDVLASRFERPLYAAGVEVVPDPGAPDPAMVAQALASAMDEALCVSRPISVRLHPIRVGPDCWRSYEIHFDVPLRSVSVRLCPLADSFGQPLDAAERHGAPARCGVAAPIRLDYLARTTVAGFEDIAFVMDPLADGSVAPCFLPWRRGWSHSLVIAALLGLGMAAAAGWTAGFVAGGACALHSLMDQLGHMGGNLLAPFTWRRFSGLQWIGTDSEWASIFTVWLCVLAVFWNLYTSACLCYSPISVFRGLLTAAAVPFGAAMAFRRPLAGDVSQ